MIRGKRNGNVVYSKKFNRSLRRVACLENIMRYKKLREELSFVPVRLILGSYVYKLL